MTKTSSMWTGEFWKGAGERAVATFTQALLALIGVDTVAPVESLDWPVMLSSSVLAALLSILKSVGAGAATGTPSVGHVETPAPKRPRTDGDVPPGKYTPGDL